MTPTGHKGPVERFAKVPLCVLKHAGDLGLTTAELAVVVQLLGFRYGDETEVWPAASTVGTRLGLRRETVSRTVSVLVEKGLLLKRRRRRKTAILDLRPLLERARNLDVRNPSHQREFRCEESYAPRCDENRTVTDSIPEKDGEKSECIPCGHQPCTSTGNGREADDRTNALTSAEKDAVEYLQESLGVWCSEGKKIVKSLQARFGDDGIPIAIALAEDVLEYQADSLLEPPAYFHTRAMSIASGEVPLPEYLILNRSEWGPSVREAQA